MAKNLKTAKPGNPKMAKSLKTGKPEIGKPEIGNPQKCGNPKFGSPGAVWPFCGNLKIRGNPGRGNFSENGRGKFRPKEIPG
jgi:hypothetical protein